MLYNYDTNLWYNNYSQQGVEEMTKILIVEDEEHISRLIAMALSPLG